MRFKFRKKLDLIIETKRENEDDKKSSSKICFHGKVPNRVFGIFSPPTIQLLKSSRSVGN